MGDNEHKVTSFRITCSCGWLCASAADWDPQTSTELWPWLSEHFGHDLSLDAKKPPPKSTHTEA